MAANEISPVAVARREKHRDDQSGKFGQSKVADAPRLRASGDGLFSAARTKQAAQRSLNPENLSLNDLMKQTSRLQFSPRDNVMRGVWEILRCDSDNASMVPLLWGLSGTGKTSSIKHYVSQYGGRVFHVNCANMQVGETEGIPMVAYYEPESDGSLRWVEGGTPSATLGGAAPAGGGQQAPGIRKIGFVWLLQPIEFARSNPERFAVLFLDELNRASQSVINEMMTFISEREINGEKLPQNLKLVAACNPSIDDAVGSLSAAQRARFVHLDWPDGDPHEGYRGEYGWPVLEPTEYMALNEDGAEKTEEDMVETRARLVDLRVTFLQKNPIYYADRGRDTSAYRSQISVEEARKSLVDSEFAYGTERGWTEAIDVLSSQFLHVPAWTEDSDGHSVVDTTPGNYDVGLVRRVLQGYVGEHAAHDFMHTLQTLDLPDANAWLADPDGTKIKKLATADRVAIMAGAMSRGFERGISAVAEAAEQKSPSTKALEKKAVDMFRSLTVFFEAHSKGDSTNRPFVMSKFREVLKRADSEHRSVLAALLSKAARPTDPWYKAHQAALAELVSYTVQSRQARSTKLDDPAEDPFSNV